MASFDLCIMIFRLYTGTIGIEYGDMQLIAEAYDILKRGLGLSEDEIADIFVKWNKGVLDSFLIDITANILRYKDEDGEPVLTKILDKAGQKGTGKWTAIAALEAGTAGKTSTYLNTPSFLNPTERQLPLLERQCLPAAYLPSRRSVSGPVNTLPALRKSRSVEINNSSSTTLNKRCTRPRSYLTPRASCS
jgi:hypothetical protein